jgi:uncharacterized protein (TIGR02145 family)
MTDWRIPTDDDFKELEMHLGMSEEDADDTGWRGTDEGSKLAGGYDLWNSGNLRNDASFGDSGFNGLPAGSRAIDGSSFSGLGVLICWWSSSQSSATDSWRRLLYRDSSDVLRNTYNKLNGFSVRCLRDLTTAEKEEDDGYVLDSYYGNDGTEYEAIKIGDQGWITENLKETKYNDGTDIPRLTDAEDWEDDTDGARCEYNNDADDESDTYGFLYNWHAVDNSKNMVNPSGELIVTRRRASFMKFF